MRDVTQSHYNFRLLPEGFWKIPKAEGFEHFTATPNRTGVWPRLEIPSIKTNWKPLRDSHYIPPVFVEEGIERIVIDDPLTRPVIPGRCVSGDMDLFINGPPLAEAEPRGSEAGPGKWVKLDHHYFSRSQVLNGTQIYCFLA